MNTWLKGAAIAVVSTVGFLGTASAATIGLDSLAQCSDPGEGGGSGQGTNGIQISDVTGDLGGATDCWGTNDGNDSQQTDTATDGTSAFQINGIKYSFVAKKDIGGGLSGLDIGLTVTPNASDGEMGTWSFDPTKFSAFGDFLISLKASNSPGYAVWLFSGSDAESYSGDWNVAWGHDLSHLSIYAAPAAVVPLPAAGWLLLGGLGGLAALRRRKRA